MRGASGWATILSTSPTIRPRREPLADVGGQHPVAAVASVCTKARSPALASVMFSGV